MKKLIEKSGYYSIYEIKEKDKITYQVDSGKTILIKRTMTLILNPYRDVKNFSDLSKAKEYVIKKRTKNKKTREKKLNSLPKSLYLVLIKEESTGKTFVKVGFTRKRFINRRFSKIYGYDGYTLESILRRIQTPHAEKLESEIKDKLNKKRSIQKYRPLLESFSGYSECYNILGLDEIIEIFDSVANKV